MGSAQRVTPRRGEVFLVNFDPTIGSEIQKIRPAVVLQNDIANRYSPVTIVAAITTFDGDDPYPSEVRVQVGAGGLIHDSMVLLNQLRTIDNQRLVRKLGAFDTETVKRIEAALLISLGLEMA